MDEWLPYPDISSGIWLNTTKLNNILECLVDHKESIKVMLLTLILFYLPTDLSICGVSIEVIEYKFDHILLHVVVKTLMDGYTLLTILNKVLLV